MCMCGCVMIVYVVCVRHCTRCVDTENILCADPGATPISCFPCDAVVVLLFVIVMVIMVIFMVIIVVIPVVVVVFVIICTSIIVVGFVMVVYLSHSGSI